MCMWMITMYFNFWRIKLSRQCLWIQGYSEWIARSRNRELWLGEDCKMVRAHFLLVLRCNKPFSISDWVHSWHPSDWTTLFHMNRSTVAVKSHTKYKFLKGIPLIHHFFLHGNFLFLHKASQFVHALSHKVRDQSHFIYLALSKQLYNLMLNEWMISEW